MKVLFRLTIQEAETILVEGVLKDVDLTRPFDRHLASVDWDNDGTGFIEIGVETK